MGNLHSHECENHDYLPKTWKPVVKGDAHWMPAGKKCRECGGSFDPIFMRKQHCANCGCVFCPRCCYSRTMFRGHQACGMCCAEMSVMIRNMYNAKREAQIHDYHERYCREEDEKACALACSKQQQPDACATAREPEGARDSAAAEKKPDQQQQEEEEQSQ